jgi:phosphatidate cytidylyltransferase
MIKQRTLIGFSLAVFVLMCLYFGYINILYIGINFAIGYDICYMYIVHQINIDVICVLFLVMKLFNYVLLCLYYRNAYSLIKIITITQVSDVYQYLAGTYFGRNKIGWISKNKTYEGYMFGWLLTVITYEFMLLAQKYVGYIEIFDVLNGFYEVSMIYLLSILSGLCSSLFKRIIDIKDYSNLLGPHGGWIDRIDSVILPSIVYWFNFI